MSLPGPGLSLTPPGDHPAPECACPGDPAPPGYAVPVSGTEPPMAKTGQGVRRCALSRLRARTLTPRLGSAARMSGYTCGLPGQTHCAAQGALAAK